MKIHHLRNATLVIESGDHHILIDPMLSDKGQLPPFARWRHKPLPNPTVDLPGGARSVLERVTVCLISHCRTFVIRALQHTDHPIPVETGAGPKWSAAASRCSRRR